MFNVQSTKPQHSHSTQQEQQRGDQNLPMMTSSPSSQYPYEYPQYPMPHHVAPQPSHIMSPTGNVLFPQTAAPPSVAVPPPLNHPPQAKAEPAQKPRQRSRGKNSSSNSANTANGVDPRRYKTRMCRSWLSRGHCDYEEVCMFAHGNEDLRTVDMNVADNINSESDIHNFRRRQAATLGVPYVPPKPMPHATRRPQTEPEVEQHADHRAVSTSPGPMSGRQSSTSREGSRHRSPAAEDSDAGSNNSAEFTAYVHDPYQQSGGCFKPAVFIPTESSSRGSTPQHKNNVGGRHLPGSDLPL